VLSYGLAADVFSFGLLTWELSNCNYDSPWSGIPDEALTQAVRNGTKLHALPSVTCPEWLQDLLTQCMEVDASHRPTMPHIVVSFNVALRRATSRGWCDVR
jgi:hypothetical protein